MNSRVECCATSKLPIILFSLLVAMNTSSAEPVQQSQDKTADSAIDQNLALAGDEVLLQLESVIVTTTRGQERIVDVAASVSKKTAEEIALDQAAYQSELLNSLAGVRITQTGSTLGHMTAIRMPLNTGPYYLFLQDSIPVQSSGFFNHNGLAYTNFTSAGGVEVLKGAGTALHGSDAVAATINVLSREPGTENEIRAGAHAGSDGYWKLGFGGDAYLNEQSVIAGDYSRAESDGWRDHTAYTRDELSSVNLYDIDVNNRIKTVLLWNRSDAEMAGSLIGKDELYNNPESVGDIEDALDQGIEINRKFDFMRLSAEWQNQSYDGVDLNTIFYLRDNRNRYIATWNDNLPQNDSNQATAGVKFKADIQQERLRSIFGVDLEYTKAEQQYNQLFDFVPSNWGSPIAAGSIYDYDVDYTAIAPYARLEYQLAEQWVLAGGLRYDTNRFDYTNNTDDGQYGESNYYRVASGDNHTFRHWSPKLDLSFKPQDNQLAYARYANGFRIPQASRLYQRSMDNADFSLDPEITNTFELGYKIGSVEHQLELAIYYMQIDDTIVGRTNDQGEDYYENAGETLHRGVEASLASRLSDEFSGKIAYSYSKHNYVDDVKYGDNEQPNAPRNLGNIRLFYNPNWATGLTSMLEWQYTGSYWLDDGNSRKYDGHDIWNLKLSYESSDNIDVYAKLNNIADDIYAENATYAWGKEKYTPGSPRQIFVGLETRW